MTNETAEFERNGFTVLREQIPTAVIADLRHDVLKAYGAAIENQQETTETGLWKSLDSADRIWRLPQLTNAALRFLGCEQVRLWQDQVIIKRAQHGTSTDWHQDFPYWPMSSPSAVTCWIPLCDVDDTSGAMRFLAGSHLAGIPQQILPLNIDKVLSKIREANRDVETSELVRSVPLSLGDCTFHSGLVVHGAHPNVSDQARIAYKIVYMAEGTTFRFQWHTATSGIALREGDPIVGIDFPLAS